MKRNDTTFKEMVARIQSGELTRVQAADTYNLNPGTLNVWLSRSKLNETTKMAVRPLHGATADLVNNLDPEIAAKLAEATQKVLDGTFKSCLAAHAAYPELSRSTLTARVRKARLALEPKPAPQKVPKPPLTNDEIAAAIGFNVEFR